MTSVSQLLPNFIQGINEQPDELKKPGQVRDAVNVYPDVTEGLTKRNGYNFIKNLRDGDGSIVGNGHWFSMYRQDRGQDYRYIFYVNKRGKVLGWNADTGEQQDIRWYDGTLDLTLDYKDLKRKNIEDMRNDIEYLRHDGRFDLRTESQNDAVFICNKTQSVGMSESEETERPYEAFIEIKTLDVARAYGLRIDMVGDGASNPSIVTKVEAYDTVNFYSAGDDDDSCSAVGNYNVIVTHPLDDSDNVRDAPIIVRVSIAARSAATDGDEINCKYYVSETRLLSGGQGWQVGEKFRATIPGTFNGRIISVKYEVKETVQESTTVNYNFAVAPDSDTETIDQLLSDLRQAILDQTTEFKKKNVQIVGNGIYMKTGGKPFLVDTPESDLINIICNQSYLNEKWEEEREEDVDKGNPIKKDLQYKYPNPIAVVSNASQLPLECKNGFVAKVENTFSDDDDYYVRFVSDYSRFETNTDDTDGSDEAVRTTGQGYWKEIAKPGEKTIFNANDMPHAMRYYINEDRWVLGPVKWAERTAGDESFNPSFVDKTINNLVFYRNRLVFLSENSVVTSAAGDYTNLFQLSALAVSPSDPVDVETTTNYSTTLHAGIEINNALVIFGEFQQFLLTTDSDIFDGRTAKISQLANYHFDTDSEPFILGTNVGFMGPGKMYEMTNIFREGQVDVQEKSKLVYKTFEPGYSITESSKDEGLVVLAKPESDKMWLYKFFKENSQQDIQSAWFKWKLPAPLLFQTMSTERFYAVVKTDDDVKLLRMNPEGNLYKDALTNDEDIQYESLLELPTFYVTKAEQGSYRADTTASLVIHRIHLNTGPSNYYTCEIFRRGKDNYKVDYEQSIQDRYKADDEPITEEYEQTIPIYERNVNVTIKLTSDFPGPFTLYSLRWEGDYNTRFYQRI